MNRYLNVNNKYTNGIVNFNTFFKSKCIKYMSSVLVTKMNTKIGDLYDK